MRRSRPNRDDVASGFVTSPAGSLPMTPPPPQKQTFALNDGTAFVPRYAAAGFAVDVADAAVHHDNHIPDGVGGAAAARTQRRSVVASSATAVCRECSLPAYLAVDAAAVTILHSGCRRLECAAHDMPPRSCATDSECSCTSRIRRFACRRPHGRQLCAVWVHM